MDSKAREIINAIFAILLLLLYTLTLGYLILQVWTHNPVNGDFSVNDGIIWTINIIGGLVSAVIIANLANNEPGSPPVNYLLNLSDEYGQKLLSTVVWLYIIIWIIVGLAAFWVGVIYLPDISELLNLIGKSWLGIAIGSAYAWFGIRKSNNQVS